MRRLQQNRNGFIVCYKHKNHTSELDKSPDLNTRRKIFKFAGEKINSLIGMVTKSHLILINPLTFLLNCVIQKVLVFVATFGLLGIAIWGLTQLETKFESSWFLPQDSYIAKWEKASQQYFSNAGERVTVYASNVNFSTDISKIGHFVTELESRGSIVSSVNTFYPAFYDYVQTFYGKPINSTG